MVMRLVKTIHSSFKQIISNKIHWKKICMNMKNEDWFEGK